MSKYRERKKHLKGIMFKNMKKIQYALYHRLIAPLTSTHNNTLVRKQT